jgi:hypothetical protein
MGQEVAWRDFGVAEVSAVNPPRARGVQMAEDDTVDRCDAVHVRVGQPHQFRDLVRCCLWDSVAQFGYAARARSSLARWVTRGRVDVVLVHHASKRIRLIAVAAKTWASRVLGRPM